MILNRSINIIFVLLLLCAPLLSAETLHVENVRIWAAPDNTRVVFDISRPAKKKLTLLSDPYRLVLDIEDAQFKNDSILLHADDKYIDGVRTASRNQTDLRIVLDLKKFAQFKAFQLRPNKRYGHRLVIDLFSQHTKKNVVPTARAAIEKRPVIPRDILIAVDAGHGGEDPGAVSSHAIFEKDIILKIAKKLAHAIDAQRGMRALLIRKGDYFMSFKNRIEKAREYKADLFISVHADAFHDPRVRGASVYVLSQKGASSAAAKWLADQENTSDLIGGVNLEDKDSMLKSVLLNLSQTASIETSVNVAEYILQGLGELGKLHKKKVQSAGFAVLKSPDIPSVLIETAFISNPSDKKKLLNQTYQKKLARKITAALSRYFNKFAPPGTLLAMHQHVIEKGDTLSAIAKRYQVSVKRLRQQNKIKGDLLQIGKTLSIPHPDDAEIMLR